MLSPRRVAFVTCALAFAGSLVLSAQRRDVFVQSRNHPAIAYATAPVDNRASRLQQQLESGKVALTFKPENGYLESLLSALQVPVESQSLVFSQTSFQGSSIHITNPRAIYFNDTVAVGWVRGERVLEVAAQDAREGVVFYTLDQQRSDKPRLTRNDECLACHLSWENLGVPGLMMQSVHPLPDEISYVVGYTTNHASPFSERWGGWFVTGIHGKVRHMGNIPVMPDDKGKAKLADPRELKSVEGLFDLRGYPTPYSDVVALMVLAHQTAMTNYITRVGWEAPLTEAAPSADASARVLEAASDLVDYMLFVDAVPFEHPMQSTSGFAEKFASLGPRDSMSRSLHDLDLQHRLLRYPCSYMIYSPGFDGMPKMAKDAVYSRMWDILSGKDTNKRYARLIRADRDAIVQILRDTKKDLPASFRG